MGGMVAQELVLAEPELVRTLALGCTYCGGPGSSLRPAAVRSGWARRWPPATAPGPCGRRMRSTSRRRRQPTPELWERYQAIAAERAVAVQVIMAQAAACRSARHPRPPAGHHGPDARHPRLRRRADPGRERAPDRLADPGRPAGDLRRSRAPVLLGGARRLRGAAALPRRRPGLSELEIRSAGVTLAGERSGAEQGPAIVLLHGLTATRRYVVMGSDALRARRPSRVLAYDARGHGRSSPAPDARLRLRASRQRPRPR